jgi:hypothetical protein
MLLYKVTHGLKGGYMKRVTGFEIRTGDGFPEIFFCLKEVAL